MVVGSGKGMKMAANVVSETFDLERYLSAGVENIVKNLVKSSAFHPRESLFMAQYALAGKKATALRRAAEERGEHVPPFLIASITSLCNLHCAGCYARSLETCVDGEPVEQMSAQDWGSVFAQAREMGVGFILLAGGEPMVRRDVMEKAAQFPEILFPVFTNGTMLTGDYLDLFDRHRNLVSVLSIEGGQQKTDERRGAGIYKRVQDAMAKMREKRIAFGASVTVTSENMNEVVSREFVNSLGEDGCKAVIYVEFVPTNENLKHLALEDADREELSERLKALRQEDDSILLISFPGDEKSSGGCLAAGRGFFHINSHGGAEPCPFSPYSDINVKDHTLREVMDSKLFRSLREEGILMEEHDRGCVLYQRKEQVEALL